MFESRTIPFYLALCGLVFVAWIGLVPGSTPVSTFGWALTGMIALYAVSALVVRAGGSEQSVTHALVDAAQLNAARIAAPPQARVPPTGRSVTALEILGPL
jgi:hypothetical protein